MLSYPGENFITTGTGSQAQDLASEVEATRLASAFKNEPVATGATEAGGVVGTGWVVEYSERKMELGGFGTGPQP